MAHGALGTLFTFILLNCIEEGRQDTEMFRSEKMEALAGRDVALPCVVDASSIHVSMIEWSKSRSENKKLALYSTSYGTKLFTPNVTLEVDNATMATHLHLHGVREGDSDVYLCSLSTFPLGSIRRETELKVTASDVVATETSVTEATDSIRTTALTSQHPPVATPTDVSTDGPNTSRGFVTASDGATPHTNDTQSGATTAPATGPAPSSSSNHQEMKTHSPVSDASTTHRGSASFSTRGTRGDTSLRTVPPEVNPSKSQEGSNTPATITDRPGTMHATMALSTGDGLSDINEGGTKNHRMLALVVVLLLVILAVAGLLYRKWITKQRMDLPPPFKPPPPPVKYTSAIYRESPSPPIASFPMKDCSDKTC